MSTTSKNKTGDYERKNLELQKEINSNKVEIYRVEFYKTDAEKKKLKEAKMAWKNRVN
ncbi:MAG: hypothetical protein ACK5B9_05340 [Flavobacteriia bacterium]|jgi:hypothetical protein